MRFNYEEKASTGPPAEELVWVVERYARRVTVGFFDGFTMRTWFGSDDCDVLW
ncbi:hypothetical protein ACIBH1_44550 [Nonomuraea sp. NPDC050663]|uniref:hypothetical protein n=1 Tax=Nonomuraea sp. NPDC050663 TaxID=3364370 RepID=UPI00378911AF